MLFANFYKHDKKELDKSGFAGIVLMDLSKAYTFCAKFEAYGINKTGLNLIYNYLSNRKQGTKIILHIVNGMI